MADKGVQVRTFWWVSMSVPSSRSLRWISSTYAFMPSVAKAFANRSEMYPFECKPPSYKVA